VFLYQVSFSPKLGTYQIGTKFSVCNSENLLNRVFELGKLFYALAQIGTKLREIPLLLLLLLTYWGCFIVGFLKNTHYIGQIGATSPINLGL
jgi:hypothetical protein